MSGGAFRTAAGPGVACLTHTGNLLVHSLPGLEVLLAAPLQRALGFPFCAAPGGAGLVSLLPTPAAAELWADGPKPSQHAADESSGLPKVLPSSPSKVSCPTAAECVRANHRPFGNSAKANTTDRQGTHLLGTERASRARH